jgi:hypothetical protein
MQRLNKTLNIIEFANLCKLNLKIILKFMMKNHLGRGEAAQIRVTALLNSELY